MSQFTAVPLASVAIVFALAQEALADCQAATTTLVHSGREVSNGAILMQSPSNPVGRLTIKEPGDLFADMEDEFDLTPKFVSERLDSTQDLVQINLSYLAPLVFDLLMFAVVAFCARSFYLRKRCPSLKLDFKAAPTSSCSGPSGAPSRSAYCDFQPLLEASGEEPRWRAVLQAIPNVTTAEDSCGCTALHVAAHSGCPEMVATLLGLGAYVNACEAWEETPLHFAARRGSVDVCKLLVSYGAELNLVNSHDETPLLVAAWANMEDACTFLLERGGHAGGVRDSELPPLLGALLVQRMVQRTASADDTRIP